MTLADALPRRGADLDPDACYEAFCGWAAERGTTLYPHQDEAAMELVSGNNVILATPTGSGKSLVAVAAHFAALARDEVTFYTAPIKALVSEKFFDLCQIFGAKNVGMLTGDASVNADAPIICCTAEVLANIALREGASADIGQVVMDEFHFYSEPDRGWAWQVPLLELPQAQFLLMSATLGDVDRFVDDLTRRTGRTTTVVSGVERPVPLSFSWSTDPLHEKVEELLSTHQAPVYIVHFTQRDALERAKALTSIKVCSRDDKDAIAEAIAGFRFAAGFGKTLSSLLRQGIGVHHAGMLPRYRRLVETLAQKGLLKVICGTDTLGVGINVPIRTVLFTGLAKYDGQRQRILRSREFHQIAGRAGRAGFDTSGYVVVQAPEHVIENERALAKAGDDPKKKRKVQRKKPPEGFVSWNEDTYTKLVSAPPETLRSRMRVTHSTILNVVSREGDPLTALSRLTRDNHEDARGQARLARRAIALTRSLLESGVLTKLPEPDETGRTLGLTVDLQEDFALNQALAPFALAAFELLDPESPDFALDVVSVVEAVLDDPWPILAQQAYKARGEAIAEMKADGVEYTERMERVEDVTHPQPLAELLSEALATYRTGHPWVSEQALSPKAVVRDMYERATTFTEYVAYYEVARSEGLVLRYLTDAYRTLRQTVPDRYKTDDLDDLLEWLGETIRQTDSSLLDEWEALTDPDAVAKAAQERDEPRPNRPLTANARAFRVMVRNAAFRRCVMVADDEWRELGAWEEQTAALTDPPGDILMDADAWDAAMEAYYDEHDAVGVGPDSRSPELFQVTEEGRTWKVRQVVDDPDDHHDWVIDLVVDLDASDATGELVMRAEAFHRL